MPMLLSSWTVLRTIRQPTTMPFHDDALAGAEVEVVDLVAEDAQPAHRRVRVVAVHGDSVRVDGVAASRPVVVAQVMHVVTDDADRPVMTAHVDPHWHGVQPPRAVSGQLKSAESDVARRADLDQRG